MEGGPCDGSVIPSFLGHVASHIWEGHDRPLLTCHNRSRYCALLKEWAERFDYIVEDIDTNFEEVSKQIERSGLAHLPMAMFPHIDVPLICAFIERWQPDTNTFHFAFGEMTIMLHDVHYILGLPIDGTPVHGTIGSDRDLLGEIAEVLGTTKPRLRTDQMMYHGQVECDSIVEHCERDRTRSPEAVAHGFLLLTLGSTLFVNKSGSRLFPANFIELSDLEAVGTYSWGSATLAHLYRQLGLASRTHAAGVGGCLTLLQAWIYEYFPCFRPHREKLVVR